MIRHRLGADVAADLAARQDSFLASGEAEEWTLPGGVHALPDGVTLGQAGRVLTLVGQPDTELRFARDGLEVNGAAVRLRSLRVVADDGPVAVDVAGESVTLERVAARAGRSASAGAALRVRATEKARLVHCEGALVRGSDGAGIDVSAPRVELVGASGTGSVDDVTGILAVATGEALLSDCAARGIRAGQHARGALVLAPEIEAMSLVAEDLRGATCTGLELYAPAANGSGSSGIVALDVACTALTATGGTCQGALIGAAGPVQLRGFSASAISGTHTLGVTVVGASAIAVGSGSVDDVRGSGAGAAGLRVMATEPLAMVSVEDVTVEALGGTAPRTEAAPQSAFSDWARGIVAALAQPGFDPANVEVFPAAADPSEVVAVHVGAMVDALAWARHRQCGAVEVVDLVVHRVAGTALQLEGGLRPLRLLRAELWTSARAGWIQGEQLTLGKAAVHRHLQPLRLGPGEARVLDCVFSATPGGAAPRLDDGAELVHVEAAFASGGTAPFTALDALPYRDPGPASVPASLASGVRPPQAAVDLALADDADIATVAVAIPGDEDEPFVGARAPSAPARCDVRDPEPRAWREAPRTPESEPPADYRARDAKSLLALMLERARVTMVSWTDEGPSDMTRMLFELLAERLDHLAYEQERAVSEGYLASARLRRSVEDHARALDYRPDPGLSATTMVRFQVDRAALARAADRLATDGDPRSVPLFRAITDGEPIDIPAGTIVGNRDPSEGSVLFATEALLTYLPELEALALAETCPVGATSVRIQGRAERLEEDRWLVLSRGRGYPGHVVRATRVELDTDSTRVHWDPRRPTRHAYPDRPGDDGGRAAVVFGNVACAHHGLPVRALTDTSEPDESLDPWQALLERQVDGSETREVDLPLTPVSIQAAGFPMPDEERTGTPRVRVLVEDDEWRRVDDLSLHGPGDEVYVLRPGATGHTAVRFGDGANGSALPARPFTLRTDLTIGLGTVGNVGAFTLDRLIRFGPVTADATDPEAMITETAGPERDDLLHAIWRVTNPLPGIGGRNPEPIDRVRYRAPLQVRDALSAVAPRDYENALARLGHVAAARARVVDAGPRQLIRVTVLLADEDIAPEAEILRRWAEVRRTLEEVRMLGFDVEAVPPVWLPLDIDLVVDAEPEADPGRLRDDVREALAGNGGLLDPDTTGLGGDVRLSDIYQSVQRLPGVQAVRVQRFRCLEPRARDFLDEGVIPIGDHEVATVGGPRNPHAGLLTVSVCGGLQ